MICKFCGTETEEKNCPKCGMPMIIQPQRPQAEPYAPPAAPQPQAPQYAPLQYPAQPQAPQYAPLQYPAQPQMPQYAPPQRPAQPQMPQYAPPQRPAQPQMPQYAPPQRPPQPPMPQPVPQPANGGEGNKPMTHLQVVNMQYAGKKPASPLKLKNVFWSALVLLLPLIFLFFELFAFLSPDLARGDALDRVFHAAADSQFESVSVGELVELETGEAQALFEDVSVKEVLTNLIDGLGAEAEQILPVGAVAFFCVACAVFALLILFSCGRILRLSVFNTLLTLVGVGATFAPLLGMLVLQLYYVLELGLDGATHAMKSVAASPEALLLMLILCCMVLPALARLRRLMAKADGKAAYPLFPLRSMRYCFHGLLKILCSVLLLVALTVPVLYLCLPLYGDGTLLDFLQTVFDFGVFSYFGTLFDGLLACLKAIFGGDAAGISVYTFLQLLIELTIVITLLVLALALIRALVGALRMLFLEESAFTRGKSAEKLCRSMRTRARNIVLAPYVCIAVCQVIATLLLLFATPLFSHVDFGDVQGSMGTYYLAVFYTKSVMGLTALFSLIALGGAVLWHLLGQFSLCLVARSSKKTKTF